MIINSVNSNLLKMAWRCYTVTINPEDGAFAKPLVPDSASYDSGADYTLNSDGTLLVHEFPGALRVGDWVLIKSDTANPPLAKDMPFRVIATDQGNNTFTVKLPASYASASLGLIDIRQVFQAQRVLLKARSDNDTNISFGPDQDCGWDIIPPGGVYEIPPMPYGAKLDLSDWYIKGHTGDSVSVLFV